MTRGRVGHPVAGVIAAVALTAVLGMAAKAAVEAPSAEEIVRKFLTVRASAPKILVADASVALRWNTPLTEAPNCSYIGKLNLVGTRYAITIEREIRESRICKAADRHLDTLLEVVRETMDAVTPLPEEAQALALRLDQFEFTVRDQKVKGVGDHTDWLYLLDGRAKDPNNDPRAFHGWIDYDQAVWEEGTLTYSWGRVETKQKYTRLQDAWVLNYQYLYSEKYHSSLEAEFSNFQFSP
jgi:hypothetical protein